jgi:hypothetical protein
MALLNIAQVVGEAALERTDSAGRRAALTRTGSRALNPKTSRGSGKGGRAAAASAAAAAEDDGAGAADSDAGERSGFRCSYSLWLSLSTGGSAGLLTV